MKVHDADGTRSGRTKMLPYSDLPYRFFPPRRIAPIAWLLVGLNRWWRLPRVKRVVAVEVSGARRLDAVRGDRLLFVPNHPTHSDPEVMMEALRQSGITTQFMAAYDIFSRNRLHAWTMQKIGAFSVDREGSDPRAMREAQRVLVEGRHTLTIFPEGNVYLSNDAVTPFHEGAAFLGLKAARDLAERDVTVHAVPVSIKLTHTRDARKRVFSRLGKLHRAVLAEVADDAPPLERLRAVGVAALKRNLKNRGLEIPTGTNDLPELIRAAACSVLDGLERKIDQRARPKDSLIDRVRRARRVIHQVRLDENRVADHLAAVVWADEAMLAYRIASYSGEYVSSDPTLDRFAETVEKLAEDVYDKHQRPFGPRHAYVRFGEPVSLTDSLDAFKQKARNAVRACTERFEQAAQAGVDALIEANPHPGGRVRLGR